MTASGMQAQAVFFGYNLKEGQLQQMGACQELEVCSAPYLAHVDNANRHTSHLSLSFRTQLRPRHLPNASNFLLSCQGRPPRQRRSRGAGASGTAAPAADASSVAAISAAAITPVMSVPQSACSVHGSAVCALDSSHNMALLVPHFLLPYLPLSRPATSLTCSNKHGPGCTVARV